MRHRYYRVSERARRDGADLGLGLDGRRVADMARHAAPVTHPDGNRRYDHYILRVVDGVVERVTPSPGLRQARAREGARAWVDGRIDALLDDAGLATCNDLQVCKDLIAQGDPSQACPDCAARWALEALAREMMKVDDGPRGAARS